MINKGKGCLLTSVLIDTDFLNTCFGGWRFLLAYQIAHLTTHKPIKIHLIKVKVTLKFGSSQTVSSLNPRKFDEKITKCSKCTSP